MKRSNPPIRGHELLWEGRVDCWTYGGEPRSSCGCRCGVRPDDWATIGVNGMKRWHREHKEELRRGAT